MTIHDAQVLRFLLNDELAFVDEFELQLEQLVIPTRSYSNNVLFEYIYIRTSHVLIKLNK